MGHKFTAKVPYQRITPPEIFFNRRKFLSAFGLGILAAPMATCSSTRADAASTWLPGKPPRIKQAHSRFRMAGQLASPFLF